MHKQVLRKIELINSNVHIFVVLTCASCCLHGLSCIAMAIEPNVGLLGHYKFDGNGMDDCGISKTFDLKGTAFEKNTLYLNGKYEHGFNGYRAIAEIPMLTYEAFTISLEFNPVSVGTRNGFSASLSGTVMGTNNIITGGTSHRWFCLRRTKSNNLELTLNNQDYSHIFKNAPLRENVWNRVVCCVDIEQAVIRAFFNGTKLEELYLPPDFTLRVKPSDKDEKLTFTNYSTGNVFYGYADNLRVWNRALSDDEVQSLDFVHPVGQARGIEWGKWGAVILCPFMVVLWLCFYRVRKRYHKSGV